MFQLFFIECWFILWYFFYLFYAFDKQKLRSGLRDQSPINLTKGVNGGQWKWYNLHSTIICYEKGWVKLLQDFMPLTKLKSGCLMLFNMKPDNWKKSEPVQGRLLFTLNKKAQYTKHLDLQLVCFMTRQNSMI